jgi:hypothetical protein|tara:strand:- start:68 stop:985 length:918 start_codon:yes stop_codon:yes gene_type:complete
MEGALHYQNVPTSQGSSQRAKSSTYPTNSMYARAQETMLKMRDVAKDGMVKAAKTAKQGMASIERSINAPPTRSAAASRPVGQRTAVGVNPPGFNGDSTINGALDNDVAVSERLQGAEAAAEMLFEMRAANDGNPTPEEAEMLSELRAVCEQHLNVLARSVERGAGLISETLLMKCIGTAESLVAAIGDGEKPGGDSGGSGGETYAPPSAGGEARDETGVVDLLGGLDVGGGDPIHGSADTSDTSSNPAPGGRPATEAEEEAMIAAAIAASLAEGGAQGEQQQEPPQEQQQQQPPQPATGNLIDI